MLQNRQIPRLEDVKFNNLMTTNNIFSEEKD